jgi:flagellar hook-associated protein 3 FlgL
MRVANKSVFDASKYQLAKVAEELNNANLIVATGKRINKLSDDPVGVTQGLNIKAALANIEQLGRNISLGNLWLASSESAMSQTQGIVSELKALSVQMASATTDAASRNSAAQIVQNMLAEIVTLANTDVSGRYIFGGTKTDAAPFSQNGTYSGNNDAFTIKSGKNATIEVGSDGSAAFGTLFTTLSAFQTALETNDVSGIQNAMTGLDTNFDAITEKISYVGAQMRRIEVKGTILENMNLSNTARLSEVEDADITEAIMNLKSAEFAYQATLASSARVMTLSLVNYLQ